MPRQAVWAVKLMLSIFRVHPFLHYSVPHRLHVLKHAEQRGALWAGACYKCWCIIVREPFAHSWALRGTRPRSGRVTESPLKSRGGCREMTVPRPSVPLRVLPAHSSLILSVNSLSILLCRLPQWPFRTNSSTSSLS